METPGRLMPCFSPSLPPLMISQTTSAPWSSTTRSSMRPSESRIWSPVLRFSASVVNTVLTRLAVPSICSGVMVSNLPASSITGSWLTSDPVRIFGPCRSARMQTGLLSSFAILRTMAMSSSFCWCEPWEKFRRATSRPARTSWRNTSSLLEVGPRVATILARRAGALLRPLAPLWFVFILAILAMTVFTHGFGQSFIFSCLLPGSNSTCLAARWVSRHFGDRWRVGYFAGAATVGAQLGVELRAAQHAQRNQVEPEHQGDGRAQRAVHPRVIRKARDVVAKSQRGNEPHGRCQRGAGETAAPTPIHVEGKEGLHVLAHVLRDVGAKVVDDGDDAHAAGQGDAPAHDEGEDVERSAGFDGKMVRHPLRHDVAEDDQRAGRAHRQQ